MLQIATFPIGPLETNCYLISNAQEAVVVDPGGDPQEILEYLQENQLKLTHIMLTHLHFDHTYGIAALSKATQAPAYASAAELKMKESEYDKGSVWGFPPVPPYRCEPIEPGKLAVIGTTCHVLATPGHTAGGLAFYFPDAQAVFAGDSLFYRSVGRTDLPGGDFSTLSRSIKEQLFTLPDSTVVYPGHGPSTTIGDEKNHNPYVIG